MSTVDPRLQALAHSATHGRDPTAEVGAVVLGLVVSGSIALWAAANLGWVPLTGVLVASCVLVAACGLDVLRRRREPGLDTDQDPIDLLMQARRAALLDELDRWTHPIARLIALAGSVLVVSAGLVVLPQLPVVPAVLGTCFLASVLVASGVALTWGLTVRVPQLRRDLQAIEAAETP